MLRDFVARYKQAHPDTDVQFLDMGSRVVLERLRAERNRPQADLSWGAAHTTFQAAADGKSVGTFSLAQLFAHGWQKVLNYFELRLTKITLIISLLLLRLDRHPILPTDCLSVTKTEAIAS